MGKPEVSIIVPVYNVAPYLDKCVESLVGQTFKNIEIILIDDGSTDGSDGICDKWRNSDTRVIVKHQHNQGVSIARNQGLNLSTGNYILFVDPDDWIEADCCEILLQEARSSLSDVILFHHYIEYYRRSEKSGKNVKILCEKESMQIAILKQDSENFGVSLDVPWCKLIKKSVIDNHNITFPPGLRISQDGIFNLYLFEYSEKVTILDYYGYHYRQNEYSINYRYNPEMKNIIKKFVLEAQKFIDEFHKDNRYEKAIGVRCITMLGRVENTYLFHKKSNFSRKQIISAYKNYLSDDLLKRYINLVSIGNINNLKMKIRYICLTGNDLILNGYYFLILIKQKTLL